MPITMLEVHDIGPFDEIVFDFDESVNVFTGTNNTGKSTVLTLLAELLVYPFGIPEKLFKTSRPEWKLTYSSPDGEVEHQGILPSAPESMIPIFSDIGYACFVPALRASTNFRSSGPTVGQDINEQLDLYFRRAIKDRPSISRIIGTDQYKAGIWEEQRNAHPELEMRFKLLQTDSSLIYDQDVIQRLINLDYSAYRRRQPMISHLIENVASVASEITADFTMTYLGV